MSFRDRRDAGARLAERLVAMELTSPLVLALPRGGVPVAAEVADALAAPLDVLVSRKIGAPGHEELGIAAIAEGLALPVGSDLAGQLGVSDDRLLVLADRARSELERRVRRYRGDRPLPDMRDRDVVLVDDGLATGVTAEAALLTLRQRHPARLILAVPVCARETADRLAAIADVVVCVEVPAAFAAVGQWYQDFSQTTDDEVLEILDRFHPAPTEAHA